MFGWLFRSLPSDSSPARRYPPGLVDRRRDYVACIQRYLALCESYKAEKAAYARALADYRERERPARERREKRHADAVAFHTWQLELKAERERKFTEFLYSAQLLGDLSREELDARFRKLHPEWGRPLPPAPRALPASSQWVGEEPPRDYEPATPDLGPPPRPPRPPDTPSFKDDSALICVADSSWTPLWVRLQPEQRPPHPALPAPLGR